MPRRRSRRTPGGARRFRLRKPSPYVRYRVSQTLLYLCLLTVGVLCFMLKLPVFGSLLGVSIYVNGAFLVIGSLIALYGHWRANLSVEVVGYPLLIASQTVFAAAVFSEGPWIAAKVLSGLVFVAFALALYGHKRNLRAEMRVYDRIAHRLDDETKEG
jgi:hypothetical protein